MFGHGRYTLDKERVVICCCCVLVLWELRNFYVNSEKGGKKDESLT